MSDSQNSQQRTYWQTALELPPDVFEAWRKPNRAINPVAIVATVDADGMPRTAPFGSVRAITPRLLRLATSRYHDTYRNLCRDGRVSVALVAPPDISVSVRGRARVSKEQMSAYEQGAIVDIDIEQVKNDMVRTLVIETAITVSPRAEFESWFDGVIGEVEDMQGKTA